MCVSGWNNNIIVRPVDLTLQNIRNKISDYRFYLESRKDKSDQGDAKANQKTKTKYHQLLFYNYLIIRHIDKIIDIFIKIMYQNETLACMDIEGFLISLIIVPANATKW